MLVCPSGHTRTSELPLPPSTGLSCTNATFTPFLAAAIAAHVPANPPPETIKSKDPNSSGFSGKPKSFRRNFVSDAISFVGSKFISLQNKIASQRPSNPVKSCNAKLALLFTFTKPPSCQCQVALFVPNVSFNGTPSTIN